MDSVKKKIRAFFGRITEESVHRAVCIAVVVACLMYCVVDMTSFSVFAGTDDQSQASDYSFYTLSSVASMAYSTAAADSDDGPQIALTNAFGTLNPGSGGGVLSFSDDDVKGILGFLLNKVSLASATVDYYSLGNAQVGSYYNGGTTNPFGTYVTLGSTLSQLGIDKTGSAAETIGLFSVRSLVGSLTSIVYVFAQSISVIFNIVIKFLKLINPFKFFKSVTTTSPYLPTNYFTSHLTDIGASDGLFGNATNGIAGFIAGFYNLLYGAGMVILVVLFGYTLATFFLPSMKAKRTLLMKNWLIRGMFIIGGLALLGGTYTTVLDWIDDNTSGANSSATKVVASTFVDFENWVYSGMDTSGLNISYTVKNGEVHLSGNNSVQSLCYAINKKANSSILNGLSGSSGGTVQGVAVKNLEDASGISQIVVAIQDLGGRDVATDAEYQWVQALLDRYRNGDKITASSYESAWKAVTWLKYDTADETKLLKQYIEQSSSVSSFLESTINGDRFSNDKVTIDSGNVYNPFGCFGTTKYGSILEATGTKNINLSGSGGDNNGTGFGTLRLSAMSIYNYLNTKFDKTSMTVYSSSKAASEYIRDSHYSVNLVGNGMSSVIIFLTCLSLLVTYALLGFVFGFGMIINNIKRGIRLIVAVPGAMLGSLHSIAKVVSYTVLMIVEIIAHIFLYCLSTELLYTLCISLTNEITTSASTIFGAAVASILDPIIGIITIVFLWMFTIKLIQLKKPIIAVFEEMADNVVQKFIVGSTAAERRVLAQQAGGGAAAAGAAAGTAAGSAAGKKGAKGVTMGDFGKAVALNTVTGGIGGNAYLHTKNAKAKMEAKKAKGQAEAQLLLSQMGIGGGTSSALEEEKNLDNVAAAKKENRKTAAKEMGTGAIRATVGAVETAAGAYTGNAALAAKGAKDLAQGAMDMNNATINKDNNDAAAMAQGAQANGSQLVAAKGGDKGLTAQKNNTNIEKFDVGKEAVATAGAVVGGNLGAGAANGSINLADAKNLAGAAKAIKSGDYAKAAEGVLDAASKNGSMKSIAANGSGATTTVTTEETIEEMTKSKFSSSSQKSEVGGKKLERNDGDLVGGSSQKQVETTSNVDTVEKLNQNVRTEAGTVNSTGSVETKNPQTVQSGETKDVTVNSTQKLNQVVHNEAGTVTEVGSSDMKAPQTTERTRQYESTENATMNKKVLVGSQTTFEQVGGNEQQPQFTKSNTSNVMGTQETQTLNRHVSYNENIIEDGNAGSANHPRTLNPGSGQNTSSFIEDEHTEHRKMTKKTVTTTVEQHSGNGQAPVGGSVGHNTQETVQNTHTVNNQNNVEYVQDYRQVGGGNVGPKGGSMGNFAPQNTQSNQTQTHTTTITHDSVENHVDGSRRQTGNAGGRNFGNFNNSYEHQQVTDTMDISHNRVENHTQGGSQVNGKMNSGIGSQIYGEHRNETVRDTVNVERQTEYKETRKDSPRKPKPGSTDGTI